MRIALLVPAVAAPVLAVAAMLKETATDPPPRGPELPDRVFLATNWGYLPFGCTETSSCCKGYNQAALLVSNDALWLGTNAGTPVWIPRDGNEWEALGPLLRERVVELRASFEVAVHDDARYEDLLAAMLVARSAGVHPHVVQPALPVYPHHGRGGGLDYVRYRR